jgi:hypothetical protein
VEKWYKRKINILSYNITMPSVSAKKRKVQKKQRGEKRREIKKERRGKKASKYYMVNVSIKYRWMYLERERNGWYYAEDKYRQEIQSNKKDVSSLVSEYVAECKTATEMKLENESPYDRWEITDVSWTKTESVEPADLNSIKMRESFRLDLDGCCDGWDRQLGTCVYDFITNRYGHIKGFIKTCKNIEALDNFFLKKGIDDGLENGLSTRDIRLFCEHFKVPLYAMDENERTFNIFTPEKPNHHAPSLAYRVLNNHFYPIIDNSKIRSIVETIKCQSSMAFRSNTTDAKETKEYPLEIFKDADTIIYLQEKMEETNTMPYPFNTIKYDGTHITSFVLKGTKYVYDPHMEMSKRVCKNMGVEYKGQGLSSLLVDIKDEVLGDHTKSVMNPHTFNTLTLDAVKNRVHYGLVDEEADNVGRYYNTKRLQICDINRHYTDCMYNPIENWMVLDFNDEWEPFQGFKGGSLPLGLYYVETQDTTLLHKTNIYSSAIVEYAKKEKIHMKVVAQLKASHNKKKEYFKPLIDKIIEYAGGDKTIEKHMCNMLSGMLGRHRKTTHRVNINSDFKQVFTWFERNASKKRMIMDEFDRCDRGQHGCTNVARSR